MPSGPVTLMVHMASVWVPFTSESKEAIAGYPEIQKELRLALQAVGRKLGMYLRRRNRVKHEGQRRAIFLRYLGEVAGAVSRINRADRDRSTSGCWKWPGRKTAEADVKLDDRGRPVESGRRRFRQGRADRRSERRRRGQRMPEPRMTPKAKWRARQRVTDAIAFRRFEQSPFGLTRCR